MPHRYITTETMAGVNLYQSYPATGGYPTVPSALAELGLNAGLRVNGSNNTQWVFVNTGTASPVVTAGTAVAINASTFVVQTGSSTLNGTALVGNAASVPGGMWMEVSGATLTLTPLSLAEEAAQAEAEAKQADADAKAAEARAKAAHEKAQKAEEAAKQDAHAASAAPAAKNATTTHR